jgi:hypothetical protein
MLLLQLNAKAQRLLQWVANGTGEAGANEEESIVMGAPDRTCAGAEDGWQTLSW